MGIENLISLPCIVQNKITWCAEINWENIDAHPQFSYNNIFLAYLQKVPAVNIITAALIRPTHSRVLSLFGDSRPVICNFTKISPAQLESQATLVFNH